MGGGGESRCGAPGSTGSVALAAGRTAGMGHAHEGRCTALPGLSGPVRALGRKPRRAICPPQTKPQSPSRNPTPSPPPDDTITIPALPAGTSPENPPPRPPPRRTPDGRLSAGGGAAGGGPGFPGGGGSSPQASFFRVRRRRKFMAQPHVWAHRGPPQGRGAAGRRGRRGGASGGGGRARGRGTQAAGRAAGEGGGRASVGWLGVRPRGGWRARMEGVGSASPEAPLPGRGS